MKMQVHATVEMDEFKKVRDFLEKQHDTHFDSGSSVVDAMTKFIIAKEGLNGED